jgi:hypothetical protein
LIVTTVISKKVLHFTYSKLRINNNEKIAQNTKNIWHNQFNIIKHGIKDYKFDGLDIYSFYITILGPKIENLTKYCSKAHFN